MSRSQECERWSEECVRHVCANSSVFPPTRDARFRLSTPRSQRFFHGFGSGLQKGTPGHHWCFPPGSGKFLEASSSTSTQSLPAPLDGGVNVRLKACERRLSPLTG